MVNTVHHEETSRDSFFQEITDNLEYVFGLFQTEKERRNVRFIIPILCAAKLECFVNVAGKKNIESWDKIERLAFKAKCLKIADALKIEFDTNLELNKSAIEVFEIRNELVHPKMRIHETDEMISQQEYETRSNGNYSNKANHPLRAELTNERIAQIKQSTDAFIDHWGKPFLTHPDYWLRTGSTGSYTGQSR